MLVFKAMTTRKISDSSTEHNTELYVLISARRKSI
jgi:hypothetical protein